MISDNFLITIVSCNPFSCAHSCKVAERRVKFCEVHTYYHSSHPDKLIVEDLELQARLGGYFKLLRRIYCGLLVPTKKCQDSWIQE